MATKFIAPFELQPFTSFIREELNRREQDVGFQYTKNDTASWDDNGDWNTYKGPLRCWVRICSNGIGSEKYGSKEGFVMGGINGFYKDYGFDPVTNAKKETVLGYTPSGEEHKIEGEYAVDSTTISKHVPPPGIISVDAVIQKSLYRQVTIKWKCYSKDHLNYLTPYMMTPGVSMFIEWGWNHYNPKCLLNLMDIGRPALMKKTMDDKTPGPSGDPDDPRTDSGHGLLGLYTDPLLQQTHIEQGKGMYELTCGIISSFDFSVQADGSYDCTTEVKSNSFIYSGTQVKSNALASTSTADSQGNKKPEPVKSLKAYIDGQFKEIPKVVLNNLDNNEPLFPNSGFPGPETRVFIPRNLDTSKDPRTKQDNVTKFSFDSGATDDFWITMGLFIDIVNKFCEGTSEKTGAAFSRIDISSSWIGGHKNLISTDGKVLLIPNAVAPNISPDVEDRGKSTLYQTPPTQQTGALPPAKSEADKTLESVFNVAQRQDLNEIINYFRINYGGKQPEQVAFPTASYDYYTGKLENLYVHKDVIIAALQKSETITDVLNYVLNKINEAANNMWQFNIIQYGPSNSLLSIIDIKSMSIKRLQDLGGGFRPFLYFFKNRASKNTIISLSMSVKLSDKVATQVLYNSPKDNRSTVPISNPFKFTIKDRFFKKTLDDSYLTPSDRETLLKQQQNPEKEREREDQKKLIQKEKDVKSGAFVVGIIKKETVSLDTLSPEAFDQLPLPSRLALVDPFNFSRTITLEQTYIRKLVLTQKDLLNLLVNDQDPYNMSVNGMPQPDFKVEISLLGIAGLKTFQIFGIDNLPEPYDKDILFQVNDVKHSLQSNGMWTTTITASLRPVKALNLAAAI